MSSLLIAFVTSLAATLLLVRSMRLHAHHSSDRDFSKPQKFHAEPVPRIGGLAIVLGVLIATVGPPLFGHAAPPAAALLLLACAIPAFVAGFIQDLTEAITPRGRLLATAASAVLAFFALDAAIEHTAIPGIDWLVSFTFGSLVLTVFAVSGIANAINIIDGFNGLASMCVMLMLSAVAYVAVQLNDPLVTLLALAGIGAIAGFFLLNFPSGLIFLGDGGAYFLGFYVAELCILLLVRNPEVSPLFPLLVCIYPAFETVFSIYRRWFLRQMPPQLPDGIHLHSLVFRRVVRWAAGDRSAKARTRRNSMTSPLLWVLCMASVVPACLFWDRTPVLAGFLVLFILSYLTLYQRIVRFQSPKMLRWLSSRSHKGDGGDNRGHD